jgi:hypothetical protein
LQLLFDRGGYVLFEVRDLWFRCHFVFVVMHLESRKVLRAVTTREPTSAWLAQQLRELTPFGRGPKFLLRDHDAKFGRDFDAVAKGAGTRIVRTPVLAPKANCYVERLIGSIRRECIDHILVHDEAHLQKVLDEYRDFFNDARPHQGIGQRRPATTLRWSPRLALQAELSSLAPSSAAFITTTGSPHDHQTGALIAVDQPIGPDRLGDDSLSWRSRRALCRACEEEASRVDVQGEPPSRTANPRPSRFHRVVGHRIRTMEIWRHSVEVSVTSVSRERRACSVQARETPSGPPLALA